MRNVVGEDRDQADDDQPLKQREKMIPPQGAPRLPEALDRLVELYTATTKPDEAKKWRAERARYREANRTVALEK